jgi:hypothetical protein
MSGSLTIASRIPTAVLMTTPGPEGPVSVEIAGGNHPDAIFGWGMTSDIDPAAFDAWLAANPHIGADVVIATQQHIDGVIAENDPSKTHGYELGLVPPEPVEPPVNVDIPAIWQEEQRMRCTMGNWENEPTSYDYQWVQDGTLNIGPNNDTLPLIAENDGHSICCVVTATNDAGSTEAPPSNEVVYHAPTVATAAMLISGDFDDNDWANMISQIGGNASAWQGFDLVVDGLNLTLRAQFPGIVDAQGICGVINANLGAYLTASISDSTPWQVFIHSNSTGIASTISYASAPSTFVEADGTRKATTDISLTMRLRQSVGAITVQGIDASGVGANR